MRTFVRGTDKGNALLLSVALVFILSTAVMLAIPRILALKKYAAKYRTEVLEDIEKKNMEIMLLYDLR